MWTVHRFFHVFVQKLSKIWKNIKFVEDNCSYLQHSPYFTIKKEETFVGTESVCIFPIDLFISTEDFVKCFLNNSFTQSS